MDIVVFHTLELAQSNSLLETFGTAVKELVAEYHLTYIDAPLTCVCPFIDSSAFLKVIKFWISHLYLFTQLLSHDTGSFFIFSEDLQVHSALCIMLFALRIATHQGKPILTSG